MAKDKSQRAEQAEQAVKTLAEEAEQVIEGTATEHPDPTDPMRAFLEGFLEKTEAAGDQIEKADRPDLADSTVAYVHYPAMPPFHEMMQARGLKLDKQKLPYVRTRILIPKKGGVPLVRFAESELWIDTAEGMEVSRQKLLQRAQGIDIPNVSGDGVIATQRPAIRNPLQGKGQSPFIRGRNGGFSLNADGGLWYAQWKCVQDAFAAAGLNPEKLFEQLHAEKEAANARALTRMRAEAGRAATAQRTLDRAPATFGRGRVIPAQGDLDIDLGV